MSVTILEQLTNNYNNKKSFALLYRPHTTEGEILEILEGDMKIASSLGSIELNENEDGPNATFILVPYCQLRERGFAHVDDDEKLLYMNVKNFQRINVSEFIKIVPMQLIKSSNDHFDIDDQAYSEIVNKIKADEIGSGEGSNFVIKRTFITDITNYGIESSLNMFKQLLQNETGVYWTFLIHTGDRTLVGASPELHVKLKNNIATMNPISGTYRYPPTGPTLEGIKEFLSAAKEADELYMVVEEELKMMAGFCSKGGTVKGPFLKEMSRLAHTEYFVEGETSAAPTEILLKTLFAPTVTGSPLENACRVIAKYEPGGRAYYAGVGALIKKEFDGNYSLDSTILIRTADIDNNGQTKISVGSTIVRHSDPIAEAAETSAKAKALLQALNIF